jgi:hypothetical protein
MHTCTQLALTVLHSDVDKRFFTLRLTRHHIGPRIRHPQGRLLAKVGMYAWHLPLVGNTT